ncbi:MAG TPA: efflux RND transporter periplasmic adaptor subunit [Candidatus Acidoferrales bacterium]|jgi:cobalt-zinc-cadmium efflux system membrane fusion protein|nr:efflux RND transporter periplasmic adaptor subunit [Candidatus Acidoferrales bacterium]
MNIKNTCSIRKIANACRALSAGALAASLFIAGCGSSADQAGKMTSFSTTESAQNKAEMFTLPADQMSHIQVFTVVQAPVARMLRTSGVVAYNAFLTTPVISQVGGPVSRIMVTPGQEVKKGEAMLYVTSPDYSLARSAYVKARDSFQLADRIYKRDKDLLDHKAIAEADLEQAESVRAQAEADLQSSEQSIRILGIANPDDLVNKPPSSEVALLAPMAGEVVERLCSPGQLLQTGATQCFTLSNMSSVWVLVNIYQNDVAYVHVGDEVTISNEAYPGEVHGKIQYIAPALDPTTRTLQARIEAQNSGERLKKDMYVTAQIRAGVIPKALMIPDASVLRDTDNMPYVYIETGDNQFARRMVTLGESQGGKTQVTDGLRPGDKIVGDGSLFLQFQNSLQR